MALIPFKRVVREVLAYLPFTGVSALHLKTRLNKQEVRYLLHATILIAKTAMPNIQDARRLPSLHLDQHS